MVVVKAATMCRSTMFVCLSLILPSLFVMVCSQFQIKEKACGGTGIPSSSFLPVMLQFALLPDLTPSNGSAYAANYVSGTERAYGEALCDGAALKGCGTCNGCLTFLKDHILQYCGSSTQVFVWAHECFIHFDINPF